MNEDKGKQLVENIILDTQLIKSNYLDCLSSLEIGNEVANICKDEVIEIKFLHEKTKENLLVLANLRKKGVLSIEAYNSYI